MIDQAISENDQFMYDQGIVAVGDISNKKDTLATKLSSKIRYSTFVEMFDFLNPGMTQATIGQYEAVYESYAAAYLKDRRVSGASRPYIRFHQGYLIIFKIKTVKEVR
ncbi:MAG: hypothetical protein IPH36_03850 [Saprospiraceae bacterium]|nr:hypothetical protein [Saprospiraceae bacterium]